MCGCCKTRYLVKEQNMMYLVFDTSNSNLFADSQYLYLTHLKKCFYHFVNVFIKVAEQSSAVCILEHILDAFDRSLMWRYKSKAPRNTPCGKQ